MELEPLADVELKYNTLEMLDYGAGGQIYGTNGGDVVRGPTQGESAVDEPCRQAPRQR